MNKGREAVKRFMIDVLSADESRQIRKRGKSDEKTREEGTMDRQSMYKRGKRFKTKRKKVHSTKQCYMLEKAIAIR